MNADTVIVKDTLSGEVIELRRSLFENEFFNPDGLFVETDDTRSGCVDCGTAPSPEDEEVIEDDESLDEEEED